MIVIRGNHSSIRKLSVYTTVLTVLTANILTDHFIDELMVTIKFHGTLAVAAIPKSVVQFLAVRGLVVNEKHILFLTCDVRDHAVAPGSLIYMPDDLRIGFPAVKLSTAEGPELGEIKLVALSLVPVGGQQFALQDDRADLGTSTADIEDTVGQLPAGALAGEIIGRKPYPRRGKVFAPVLVRITVTVLFAYNITLAVPDDLSGISGLHTFRMPEHFK